MSLSCAALALLQLHYSFIIIISHQTALICLCVLHIWLRADHMLLNVLRPSLMILEMQSQHTQPLLTHIMIFSAIPSHPVGKIVLKVAAAIYLKLCTPLATHHSRINAHAFVDNNAIPVPDDDCSRKLSPHCSTKRRHM